MRTVLVDSKSVTRPYAVRINGSSAVRQRGGSATTYPMPPLDNRAAVHERRSRAKGIDLRDLEMDDTDDAAIRRERTSDRRRIYETGFMDGGECILAYDPSGRLASALRFHDDD